MDVVGTLLALGHTSQLALHCQAGAGVSVRVVPFGVRWMSVWSAEAAPFGWGIVGPPESAELELIHLLSTAYCVMGCLIEIFVFILQFLSSPILLFQAIQLYTQHIHRALGARGQ